MSPSLELPGLLQALHALCVIAIALRVVMRRPARGVALAWLFLVAIFPFAGPVIYLLIGERRISRRRQRTLDRLRVHYASSANAVLERDLSDVDWSRHGEAAAAMDRLGRHLIGSPTLRGSRLELFDDTRAILDAIRHDIDAARETVFMEFYIWQAGGRADAVLEAVLRAAARGVLCRLLIDALGARDWWKGDQPRRLRDAGVELRAALPAGVFQTLIGRTDLRLHRKLVVIDGAHAWTGSMNLVDPEFFKAGAGYGEWVDAMVRVEGPAVLALNATLIGDWLLERGEPRHELLAHAHRVLPEAGSADVQLIPSGPTRSSDTLLQMLLALINAAREELVLTTPYLVPDDALALALRGAAARGVRVLLILPEKVDSFFTRFASRSYFEELLEVGVEIRLFHGGLLHTKSIVVDETLSMFGTVNLDMRSLWLNYELTLFIYDAGFARDLRDLQEHYLARSHALDRRRWRRRPFAARLLENAMRIASPLL
ncbi:MAG: cardiolipin synthase [Candidatus Dactylopiibacterium sp.]|nr:cardiolipin synthase [Candidatus Dactylopiibacterium sp.]